VFQERAFSTPATTHHDKDIPLLDRERKILLNQEITIFHGKVINDDVWA
jgi:hypothetical protein